jgi:Uma2 family endonuclease
MSVSTAPVLLTADDLGAMPDDGTRYELFDGVLHRTPPDSDRHDWIDGRLTTALYNFVTT